MDPTLKGIKRFFAQIRSSKGRIRKRYKKKFGYYPNLKNPRTFNEKLLWRKLHDHNPLMITCVDKFAVRQWIADRIGEKYLIPLLTTATSAHDIPWDDLPRSFVIKATHGSGWTKLVFDKEKCNQRKIEEQLQRWLATNYYDFLREWQYRTIKPRIIIEELLLTPEGTIPDDCKIHCFHSSSSCKTITLMEGDRLSKIRHGYFDNSWNHLPLYHADLGEKGDYFPKPKQFEKMLEIAESITKPFGYARADLYNIGDNIYFGEITFNPASGMLNLTPSEWGRKLGDYWELPPT